MFGCKIGLSSEKLKLNEKQEYDEVNLGEKKARAVTKEQKWLGDEWEL